MKDLKGVRAIITNLGVKRNGSITAAFAHIGKEKVSYSHCQYTYTETRQVIYLPAHQSLTCYNPSRVAIICWIAEAKHPFAIVKDRGFMDLMKTSHPMYRLPSPPTVAHDMKHVFVNMRSLIAAKLKVLTFFPKVHGATLR